MPDCYCQRCLAANPLGQEFCTSCGTRLMILVEPAAARYETADATSLTEEHLLERISALENQLSRSSERLEQALDLLLSQVQNSHFDRALVKSLVSLLSEQGIVETDRLEKLWIDQCEKLAQEQQQNAQRETLRLRILNRENTPEFTQLINDAFVFIGDDQLDPGLRLLQRAAELSADNLALLYFIGELFFRTGKLERARSYLNRVYEISPNDVRVSLLLGLTCADEGDINRAKELLTSATRLGASSFAAHYGLGRVFVAEEKWRAALQEFKLALASKDSPEAHYALGCLYYQLCRDSLAIRHLKKALEMDEAYSEASYVLSLISRRGRPKKQSGSEHLKNLNEVPLNSRSVPDPGKQPTLNRRITAPLFRKSSARTRRLITGGDKRLAEALRRDALHACSNPEPKTR